MPHAICIYCGSPWCTCLDTDEEYENVSKYSKLLTRLQCSPLYQRLSRAGSVKVRHLVNAWAARTSHLLLQE